MIDHKVEQTISELRGLLTAAICEAYPVVASGRRFELPHSKIQAIVTTDRDLYWRHFKADAVHVDLIRRIWVEIYSNKDFFRTIIEMRHQIFRAGIPIFVGIGTREFEFTPEDLKFLRRVSLGKP